MAKYRVISDLTKGKNTLDSTVRLIETGSGLKRIEQSALRIIRGEENIPTSAEEVRNLLLNNIFGRRPDKFAHLSRLGTPVRNYLKILDGSYDVLDGVGQLTKRRYQGLFLDTAVISVNMPKNIVLTEINGNNGTRKEHIGNGDYQIQIVGELTTDHPDIYPAAEVAALRDIINSPEPLTVICPHLLTFGINTIVVKGVDFPQQEGVYNVQKFAISALSHSPIDIYIEEVQRDLETNRNRLGQIIEDAGGKFTEMSRRIDEELNGFLSRGQE
jgi:hypothetical protein